VWGKNLTELAQSGWARTAMLTADMDTEGRLNAVADSLEQSKQWAKSVRSLRDSAGRYVVSGEITQRQAALDHAGKIIDMVDQLTHTPNGDPLPGLTDYLMENRKAPTSAALAMIPDDQLPAGVRGTSVMAIPTNKLRAIMDSGFDHLVGRPMNLIARQPMFIDAYAKARIALADTPFYQDLIERFGEDNPAVTEAMSQVAQERAVLQVKNFIHNPEIRSQFAVITRNLMPFWFAQEQFYARWAKTFAYAPEMVRELQLTMNGFRHSGMIHKDDQGNEYFLYPAVGVAQQVISHAYEAITGQKATLPIPANFRGQIKFISPGTERLGLPSFGPLVSVPLNGLATHFPELTQPVSNVLGQRGAGRPMIDQILPTTIDRAYHALMDQPSTSSQMNSAMMQAIQYLEATGHGLPENATPAEKQVYIDRVKNWTRSLMYTRLVFGFGVPASPENQIQPSAVNQEFTNLLGSGMSLDTAIKTFIQMNPDATPYTVFQSESTAHAPLPSTQAALDFMTANSDFLKDYPDAGAWFLPQKDTTGTYNQQAYQAQLALQLRVRKTPDQFWQDIKYAEDANTYFAAEDRKNAALAQAHGSQATAIRQAWTSQSQAYLTAHPVFASLLADNTGQAALQRQRAISQMTTALADPRVPQNAQTDELRTLIGGWNTYQAQIAAYSGLRNSGVTNIRKRIETQFAFEVQNWIHNHPDMSGVYNRLIRPQISSAILALGGA
jgi:hypothetical protein